MRCINREALRLAMDNIAGGMFWLATPQGHDYWRDVYLNLGGTVTGRAVFSASLTVDPFSEGG
jgi:hypothetical protein